MDKRGQTETGNDRPPKNDAAPTIASAGAGADAAPSLPDTGAPETNDEAAATRSDDTLHGSDATPPASSVQASLFDRLAAPALAIPQIAAAGLLIYLVNLGGYPLYTKGEPREAVTIFDIVHGGGVILPMRAGVEIPSKPLLMHWLAAIVSLLAGRVDEWTVRLPSAMLAIGGMLACYFYVRRLFDQRAGLLSALMLGTSFQYIQAGTGCRVDMTLAFFMEIAFFEFLMIAERLSTRTTVLYLAIACAVMTKGPIGAALPVLVATVWMLLGRRFHVIPRLKLGHGVAIVGIIAGAWYVAAAISGGMGFVRKQILAENIYRLFHHSGFHEGHEHSWFYMELALAAGFMPWTLAAVPAAVEFMRGSRRIDQRLGYIVVWFVTVLVFYNFPQSKRGVYLLALYPALATMVGILIADMIARREETPAASPAESAIDKWITATSWIAGLALLGAGAAEILGLVSLYTSAAPLRWILSLWGITAPTLIPALERAASGYLALAIGLPLATMAAGVVLVTTGPRAGRMVAAIASGIVFVTLGANLVIVPATANALTLKSFAAAAMRTAGNSSIAYFGMLDYDFAFYSGRSIPIIERTNNWPDYLVCSDVTINFLPPQVRTRYVTVLKSGPTDLDGSGIVMLLKRTGASPAPPPNSATL